MVDEFKGTRGDYFLQIPHRLARNWDFLRWFASKEGQVWLYLQSYIKREPEDIKSWVNIYNEYFVKRKELAVRWSQVNIAKMLHTKKSHVSEYLSSMAKKKFIRTDKYKTNRTTINVYILGTHDGVINSSYFVFTHFIKEAARKNLEGYKI